MIKTAEIVIILAKNVPEISKKIAQNAMKGNFCTMDIVFRLVLMTKNIF